MSGGAEEIARRLDLRPHPEGGLYRETFRDRPGDGGRGALTAIYYLLREGELSAWHRVTDAVEVWHHYAGAPLELLVSDDGREVRRAAARRRPRRPASCRRRRCRPAPGRARARSAPGRSPAARWRRPSSSPASSWPPPAGARGWRSAGPGALTVAVASRAAHAASRAPGAEDLNPYHIAQQQFDRAARFVPQLRNGLLDYLRRVSRVMTVEFPVEMDDGSVRTFVGYRVLHSRVRGPGKGGIRYHPDVTARRGAGAGLVDDLEVRRHRRPVRRRQGRRRLRPQGAVARPSCARSRAASSPSWAT